MLRRLCEALDKRHKRKSLHRLATAFDEEMLACANADIASKLGTASSARKLHHAFIAKYPEIRKFLDASHADKSAYLSKLTDYVERLSKGERAGKYPQGATRGAILVQFWITALAWGDFKLADAMADQLEPLNRSAYETACAMGQAKADEAVIAKWKEKFGENIDPFALTD